VRGLFQYIRLKGGQDERGKKGDQQPGAEETERVTSTTQKNYLTSCGGLQLKKPSHETSLVARIAKTGLRGRKIK